VILCLTIASFFVLPTQHPKAIVGEPHKNGIVGISYDESLRLLESMTLDDIVREPERLTDVFARRISHYWPAPGQVDPEVFYSFVENWFLAVAQRVEGFFVRLGLVRPRLVRVERRAYRAALAGGVGYCSQVALAIADYMPSNTSAGIVPLGGHVVAFAHLGSSNYVLDGDYNVTFKVGDGPPSTWGGAVRTAYAKAGYSPSVVESVARIYERSKAQGPVRTIAYEPKSFFLDHFYIQLTIVLGLVLLYGILGSRYSRSGG
jgi:hypothetical protein